MFPLIVAIELPGKRGANQDGGDDAKSNGTKQAPSHRRPLIRTQFTLMNGLVRIHVNRRFRCRGSSGEMQFFVIM
jgi:hypothetical protein